MSALKTCVILQPYLFPYMGYFQLAALSDVFVSYDDAQFMKGGWINRNRILLGQKDHLFTIALKRDSVEKRINERFFSEDFESEKRRVLSLFENAYRRAPYFAQGIDIAREVFACPETNVSHFINNQLKILFQFLEIKSPFLLSSSVDGDKSLKSKDRVLDLVRNVNANAYVNPIGGMDLYDKTEFKEKGIKLSFIQTNFPQYNQGKLPFIPHLSIIDVLMFNPREFIIDGLKNYTLV